MDLNSVNFLSSWINTEAFGFDFVSIHILPTSLNATAHDWMRGLNAKIAGKSFKTTELWERFDVSGSKIYP